MSQPVQWDALPFERRKRLKKKVERAEAEVMAGDESEVLLILVSLNLDKMLDENDVRRYLNF